LLPLLGISLFSYFIAKQRITEDRIVLYLEQIADDIADTIQLTLLEKKEETVSMTLYGEFRDYLTGDLQEPPRLLLDKLVLVHEVYDLIGLFDVDGRLLLLNRINRHSTANLVQYLDERSIEQLEGESLLDYTPDGSWLQKVRASRFGYIDWHSSPLVNELYNYFDADIARQYCIGFAAPILDERNVVVGGVVAFMNWEFIQEILDKVEEDLETRSLSSGYAFLFGNDQNTIIGHKYRRNRNYPFQRMDDPTVLVNNYGTRLVEDLSLDNLHNAVVDNAPFFEYEYPPGQPKISGLAGIDHEFFHWMCGVGINDEDIFAPVQELRTILIWVSSVSALVIVLLTFSVARRITVPLKKLTLGAQVIAKGDYSQRVEVSGKDEIGTLARSFNEMAASLQERSQALIDLNRSLEEKVSERTRELEATNEEVKKAYQELKETQFQLVQSEKMASLGQLVAGIAHEIKNPLNFVYGNTEFLKQYVEKMVSLVKLYEAELEQVGSNSKEIEAFKQQIHYEFMVEDLNTLIDNFEEGARRIHSIISDLRTFSRMDSDDFRKINIHDPIELSLNLLQNEYKGRITIHKDYSELPQVSCHSGKISQVFMNLLSNACQAINGEGEIWIRTRPNNSYVCIEIEDTGSGIEEGDLERIFEPFFTTKTVGKGTGLGLSISYAIVEQHDGRIEVDSKIGKGTTFRVLLPVSQ